MNIPLQVAEIRTVDFILIPGSAEQSVTVESSVQMLQVADSSLSQVIDQKRLEEVPLNGRSMLQLTLALSAAAAYGRTQLTANVPFSFRTASRVQPAGQYQVVPVSYDGSVARLQNMETGHSAMTGIGTANGNPNDKTPQLVFRCGSESGCVLVTGEDGRWARVEMQRTEAEAGRSGAHRGRLPRLKPS